MYGSNPKTGVYMLTIIAEPFHGLKEIIVTAIELQSKNQTSVKLLV